MKQGHFHAHIKAVSRTKGYSAVAAAAYQSGQSLTHEKQRQFSVDLDHRKHLNKGVVSDVLRQEFAARGIMLSEQAAARKEGRRDWTIIDGDSTYGVKEFEHKVTNPETGKRETASRILDVYVDKTHNYTTREDVKETWVQAPDYAPGWVKDIAAKGAAVEKKDRETLWNWAETAEIARDARTARTFQLSLSRELSYDQNKALLREYIDEQLTPHGFIADIAIHSKKASDGKENPHAHILITTRPLTEDGALAKHKAAPWDAPQRVTDRHKAWSSQLRAWRAAWADKQNTTLEAAGSDTRVDHRSYEAQGVDVIPSEHVGAAEWNRSRRGEKTDAVERNAAIEGENVKRDTAWKIVAQRVRLRKPKDAPEKGAEREYYAGRITVHRWFGLGSKTTHTYLPGLASLPRKERDALDKSTPRLTPGEVHERLSEAHERTLGAYLLNNQSGGSPQEALERLQRIAKTIRQKVADDGKHFAVHYTNWRSRIAEQRQNQRSDEDKRER